MCDIDVTIFTDKTVTAKKDHVCDECVGVIEKGTKYNYMSGLSDGFFTNKAHLECSELARKVDIDGEGCFGIGNLRYDINEAGTEEQRYEYWWITKKYPDKRELEAIRRKERFSAPVYSSSAAS